MKANVALVLEDVLHVKKWAIKSDSVRSDRMTKEKYMRPQYKGLGRPREVDILLPMPRGGAEEETWVLEEK